MSPLDVSNREVLGYLGCGGALLLIYAYVLFRLDRNIRIKGYQ
jgi:non-ribosomal peptide synthetase component F